MKAVRWIFVAMFLVILPRLVGAASPPPLELVDVYRGGADLSRYWVSEKYDGVRGYWDGHRMWTRAGTVVAMPAWFTRNWPHTAMDGELWAGYGRFEQASTIVRASQANDAAWHEMSYRVFDLPARGGAFDSRVPAIRAVVASIGDPWVVAVNQFHVENEAELKQALERVLDKGGEGLVLHRGDAPYRAGRSVGLFKVKPYEDAEAKVVAIQPGRGRLEGMMGSIAVRTPDGHRFAIGSGFTDEERLHPPPVGSWVTYRFNGVTDTGLPRFVRFLRMRPGGPPPEATAPRNRGRDVAALKP